MRYHAEQGTLRCTLDEFDAIVDFLRDPDQCSLPETAVEAGVLSAKGEPLVGLSSGLAPWVEPLMMSQLIVAGPSLTLIHRAATDADATGFFAALDADEGQFNQLPASLWHYPLARITGLGPRPLTTGVEFPTTVAADTISTLFGGTIEDRARSWNDLCRALRSAGVEWADATGDFRIWCLATESDRGRSRKTVTVLDTGLCLLRVGEPVLGRVKVTTTTPTATWAAIADCFQLRDHVASEGV